MSTLKVSSIQNPSTSSGGVSIDTSGHVTVDGVAMPSSGPLSGTRNRIINGDMRIDQRNAGASVTATGSYTLDRWIATNTQASKYTVQQSTTAPTGFSNSLLVTSLSAYSVSAGDFFLLRHYIEGFNFSDFDWGSANAKQITLSFWVRSSLTGTFGGSLQNSAENRSYPFDYTINTANTWEQKTITVAGDTSGTWVGSTNGVGVRINFGLGAGATYGGGTAGAWVGSDYRSTTGATSVVGTNGATFYITGVQLEAGSVATPFERRSYGQELALCQRYCYELRGGSTQTYIRLPAGKNTSSTQGIINVPLPVQMRVVPSLTYSGATIEDYLTGGTGTTLTVTSDGNSTTRADVIVIVSSTTGSNTAAGFRIQNNNTWTAVFSAEL